MPNHVWRFFAPPIFEDPDKTRLARILNGFGWFVVGMMLVLIFNRILTKTWVGGSASFTFPLIIVIVSFMQVMIRMGQVRFAGRFAVTLIWLTLTYQAFQADGLWDVALIAHLAIILLAALMLGWREGVIVGAFSLITIWYFAYRHQINLHEFNLDPPLHYARDLTAVFLVTSILIYYLVYNMNRSLAESNVELKERLRAEAKLQLQADYLTALHETTLGLVNRLELKPLLESILNRVAELFDTPHVALNLVLPDESALKQELGHGIFVDFDEIITHKNQGIVGKAWETSKSIIIENYGEWKERLQEVEGIGFKGVMATPLISGQKVIGVILIAYKDQQKEFTQEKAALLEKLAALASIAIDNARLYQEAQAEIIERKLAEEKLQLQAQYLNALHETTLGLVNRLELSPLLESIILRASDLLGTQNVALDLVLPDESALRQEIGLGKFAAFNGKLLKENQGIAGEAWKTGKTVVVKNYEQWGNKLSHLAGTGFKTAMCAPLKSGNKVIGVLAVAYTEEKEFTQDQSLLLERFAALVSVAIDNARLYQAAQAEILERRIIETELRASDERFRKVFNNNKVAISIVTLEEGIFLEANEAFWQITGLSPEKALGHSVLEFGLWKNLQARIDFINELKEKGSLSSVEVIFPTGQNSLAYYELINLKNQLCIVCMFYDVTELRQTERALQESEERFRQVFQASPVAICITKLEEGRLVDANQAYWNLTEYSAEESLGKTAEELDMWVTLEDRKLFVEDIKVKRSLTNPNYEFLTYKTHKPRLVIAFYELIELKEQTCVLSMFYDVTEQRQIQEALRNAESRTRAILESIPDMIFELSKDGVFLNYIASNDASPLVPPSEFIGKNVNQFFPAHIVDQTLFSLERAIATEQLHAFEYELNYDGGTRFFEARISSVTDETAIVMVRDISQRKWVETEREKLIAELENKNAESETLRESVSIVVETLDKSEAIDRILEQLEKVIPYNSASVQLLNEGMLEIVSTRRLEPKSEHIGMRFEINEDEPAFALLNGRAPYVLIEDVQTMTSVFDAGVHKIIHAWMAIPLKVKGRLIGIIALDGYIIGQFTKKDAELALTYANQVAIALENARLFSELQNELTERKRLIEELEVKNSELERFTYTVSHDLKSPLITIKGFLGFLEQDAISGNMSRLRGDIQRISDATSKMQALLNELLNLSRVGRLVNQSQQVSFNELVAEALEIVHGRLQANHIQVQVQENLPNVYGDRPRLIEVLQNLIDNAAKFARFHPKPLIQIGQKGYESDKPIFFVQDNGIGIDEAHHERIFGLFNKLDVDSEGTGVGLALVKRIVELHDGRIWIESEVGKGATFYFTLPTQLPE